MNWQSCQLGAIYIFFILPSASLFLLLSTFCINNFYHTVIGVLYTKNVHYLSSHLLCRTTNWRIKSAYKKGCSPIIGHWPRRQCPFLLSISKQTEATMATTTTPSTTIKRLMLSVTLSPLIKTAFCPKSWVCQSVFLFFSLVIELPPAPVKEVEREEQEKCTVFLVLPLSANDQWPLMTPGRTLFLLFLDHCCIDCDQLSVSVVSCNHLFSLLFFF